MLTNNYQLILEKMHEFLHCDSFPCLAVLGFKYNYIITAPASDCHDILNMNLGTRTGIYWIKLWKSREMLPVLCDLETADGGWTVYSLVLSLLRLSCQMLVLTLVSRYNISIKQSIVSLLTVDTFCVHVWLLNGCLGSAAVFVQLKSYLFL